MDSERSRDYVLLEGWSEVAAFETISEGLRFQDFMENLHPRRKFDLCLKRGGFMRLRAGYLPLDDEKYDKDPLEWLKIIAMKGGEQEHGRRNEDIPSNQSGRPGELP